MMRVTRIDSRGRSSNGTAAIDYLFATEYYFGKNGERQQTLRWLGKGADALGLDGAVTKKEAQALAKGYDPKTGEALSRSAGKPPKWVPKLDKSGKQMYGKDGKELGVWKGGHRVGFDCTFSAEKTVSLAFARADDAMKQRIIDAHQDAVASVFQQMEQDIETRRGQGGKQVIGVKGLVAATALHFSNRNNEVDLHTHTLTFSVAQGADNQWGSWDAKELYARQRMYSALYRTQDAYNMQKIGFGIEKKPELDDEGRKTGDVYYRIAGISEDDRTDNSSRRREILDYVAEHGGSKTDASLATRQGKQELPLNQQFAKWDQELANVPRPEEILGLPSKTEAVSDEEILRQLHSEEAVWSKTDLITRLALENVGRMDADQILREADDFLIRNDLVHIHPEWNPDHINDPDPDRKPARRYTEDRYAARWWFDGIEQDLLNGTRARQHDQSVAAKPATVDHAIQEFEKNRGFAMSSEQANAVRHLTGEGGLSILVGRAGTGKTTTTEAVVQTFTQEGRNVIGCSTSWDAAKKLHEETGVREFYSTDKLLHELDHGKTVLNDQSVVIMDEAGMAGTAQIARLAKHVNEARGKLILEGDPDQLQAISAGGGFRMLADKFGKAELTEIRRQRDIEDRQTVEMFYDQQERPRNTISRDEQQHLGGDIFERLEARGQIDHWDTRQDAIDALATDYLTSPLAAQQKIVITGTRADTAELNQTIRKGLQERGKVAADEQEFHVIDGGHQQDIKLAEGDRIRFGKKDNDLQIVNGTRGQIAKMDEKGLHVRVDDSEREIVVDPHQYQHISYDYASTVHRSQGQTREQCFHLASLGMTDRHLSLVAMSRARGKYRMYGAENDLEGIQERLGLDRRKMNAIEEHLGPRRHEPEVVQEQERYRRHEDELMGRHL